MLHVALFSTLLLGPALGQDQANNGSSPFRCLDAVAEYDSICRASPAKPLKVEFKCSSPSCPLWVPPLHKLTDVTVDSAPTATACILGETYGVSDSGVWVKGGCSASFTGQIVVDSDKCEEARRSLLAQRCDAALQDILACRTDFQILCDNAGGVMLTPRTDEEPHNNRRDQDGMPAGEDKDGAPGGQAGSGDAQKGRTEGTPTGPQGGQQLPSDAGSGPGDRHQGGPGDNGSSMGMQPGFSGDHTDDSKGQPELHLNPVGAGDSSKKPEVAKDDDFAWTEGMEMSPLVKCLVQKVGSLSPQCKQTSLAQPLLAAPSSISVGAIVGIVLGSIGGFLLLISAVVLSMLWSHRRSHQSQTSGVAFSSMPASREPSPAPEAGQAAVQGIPLSTFKQATDTMQV